MILDLPYFVTGFTLAVFLHSSYTTNNFKEKVMVMVLLLGTSMDSQRTLLLWRWPDLYSLSEFFLNNYSHNLLFIYVCFNDFKWWKLSIFSSVKLPFNFAEVSIKNSNTSTTNNNGQDNQFLKHNAIREFVRSSCYRNCKWLKKAKEVEIRFLFYIFLNILNAHLFRPFGRLPVQPVPKQIENNRPDGFCLT